MKITRSNITNTVLRIYIKVLRAYVRAFKMYVKMLKMLKTFRAELQKLAMELGLFTDLSMHVIGFSKKLVVKIALGIKDRVLSMVEKIRSKTTTSEETISDGSELLYDSRSEEEKFDLER